MSQNNAKLIEEIFTLSRLFKENMSFNKQAFHLTMLQLQTLVCVKQAKKIQMKDIAEKFKIEFPTATSMINNLIKENLVLRSADLNDRRAVIISLSAKGKKLLIDAVRERNKKMEKILACLLEKDKKDLLKIIKKIRLSL